MKRQSAFGQALLKEFRIKIFYPRTGKATVTKMRAPAGKGYSDFDIDRILEATAGEIEKLYPGEDYSLVTVGRAQFNFVWRGERASS